MGSTYHKYIAQGRCGQCGKPNDRNNRKLCSECAKKDTIAQAEAKRFAFSIGICPQCKKNKLFGNENSCPECRVSMAERKAQEREKNKDEYNAKMREYHRNLYKKRKESGLCPLCGIEIIDKRYFLCAKCRSKRLTNIPITQAGNDRVDKGLCYWCGEPVKTGYKVCEKHYQMNCEKAKKSNKEAVRKQINNCFKKY